jgi:hypothetical protein
MLCGTSCTIWSTTDCHNAAKKPLLLLILPLPRFRAPPHPGTAEPPCQALLPLHRQRGELPFPLFTPRIVACKIDVPVWLIGALNAQIICTLNST